MNRRIDALVTESGLRIVALERFVMPETARTLGEMYKGLPRWQRVRGSSQMEPSTQKNIIKEDRSCEGNQAYVRKSRIKAVVNALQEARAPSVMVVEGHPVGYRYEPNYFELGFEQDVLKRHRYLEIVKLEVVCSDADLEGLVRIIQHECHIGQRGDRMVFVTDVTDAIRIRLAPVANNRSGPVRRATRVRYIATELTRTGGFFYALGCPPNCLRPTPLSKEQQG